jgi:MFS family permease
VMYGVSEGPAKGWSDSWVITTCAAGALALGALVAVELHTPEPMLDLRLYANHLFRSTLTVITVMTVSYFGALYLASLFYQNGLGLSAQASGFNIFPQAVGFAIGSPITARKLYPRYGPRRIIAPGALVVTVVMALMATIGPGTSLWTIRAIVLGLGLGMSAIGLPAQTASFATIPAPKIGRASTLFNSQQRLGSAIGVAGITTIVIAIGTTHVVHGHVEPHLIAYRVGFLVSAAIMLINAAAALVINDADAAETMTRGRQRIAPLAEPAALEPG